MNLQSRTEPTTRLSLALLAIGKGRPIDCGSPGGLEPGARHPVTFARVRQLINLVPPPNGRR